jgi:hypothetical protein
MAGYAPAIFFLLGFPGTIVTFRRWLLCLPSLLSCLSGFLMGLGNSRAFHTREQEAL